MAYCHQKRLIPDLKSKMDEQILRQAGTRKEWTRMQLIYVTIILKAHEAFLSGLENPIPFRFPTWNLYSSLLRMLLSIVPPNIYISLLITSASWKRRPDGT